MDIKDTINPYYCLLKNANFPIKKSNEQITSHIIKFPIYCCFKWHNLSQFFEILSFSQDIWENVYYIPEISLSFEGTLVKVFHLPNKTNKKKKSEARFSRPKTAENDNVNINTSLNIPFTFLLFVLRSKCIF